MSNTTVHILQHGATLCGSALGTHDKWAHINETTNVTCAACLRAVLATREATLDAIVYKCADYDYELCEARSMTTERWPVMEGKQKAGVEIERIIEQSGYTAKEREDA